MRRDLSASLPTRLATTAAIVLLAAAAATLPVGEIEASPQTEPTPQHPCAGVPSINAVISAAEFTAGRDVVRSASAPSGDCSLTATVHLSEPARSGLPSAAGGKCAIYVQTDAGIEGTAVSVTGLGECGALSVSTRIELSPAGAQAVFAARTTGMNSFETSTARARTGVYGFYLGTRVTSDVRGTWNHSADSVSLVNLTYPRLTATSMIYGGPNAPATQYGTSPPSIDATNVIHWYESFVDNPLRLKTSVTLSMFAGGGYHCSHQARAYPDFDILGVIEVRGECFP